ncbi:hypothetical protein BGZ96_000767 [Linnemannia gamsii]|uniref:Uncharacterized protein n=1 Tax=Linnemannia gamsii TaxID=64522 RepID=A0ABQ7KB09_9FUNG|nr:hypothetical protein BGZ96_000767 [Linnemannia gamsii]
MQFKTLALAAVAFVATVNAQGFELNACSTCVFGSFKKDTSCTSLSANTTDALLASFSTGIPDVLKLSALVQDPATRTCVCHWASTAFEPKGTGAAGSCFTGTTPAPVCNTTQVGEASAGIAQLTGALGCSAAGGNATNPSGTPSGGSPKPSTSATGGAGSPTPKPAGAVQLNMPYVLSVAAIGLAAIAGL